MGRKKKSREYMNFDLELDDLARPRTKRDKTMFGLRCILEIEEDDPDYDEDDIVIPPDMDLSKMHGGEVYNGKYK